jgi:hypothetical protein
MLQLYLIYEFQGYVFVAYENEFPQLLKDNLTTGSLRCL